MIFARDVTNSLVIVVARSAHLFTCSLQRASVHTERESRAASLYLARCIQHYSLPTRLETLLGTIANERRFYLGAKLHRSVSSLFRSREKITRDTLDYLALARTVITSRAHPRDTRTYPERRANPNASLRSLDRGKETAWRNRRRADTRRGRILSSRQSFSASWWWSLTLNSFLSLR